MLAVRGGRAGGFTADIRMMPARGNQKNNIGFTLIKNRGDDCDIRQMGAAIERIVHHEHIPGPDFSFILLQNTAHAFTHRAKMDGHMWRIGHQIPLGAKNCAGKVEPLFDVYRIGRVGQCGPHLLGNRHKKIIKHLKHDRIDRGANGLGALYRLDTF